MLCNELIVNYNLFRYCFHPIFQAIYENRDKPALTPKLIGKYGLVLLALYNIKNKCDKCRNWALPVKDIKNYIHDHISKSCHNKFRWGFMPNTYQYTDLL